ncbi:patatin-like phospholipase family protein [Halosquirtibacter xylanolyticus]|uniref:patatin-like phospholipase family protein n=1 Tax=Halosquirtibacter xylanolyticus TaxID=3374599 RepID=UPI00374A36D7|nr:patatin-like phospholipase family protein [Prolixibacteraceae bacterium]
MKFLLFLLVLFFQILIPLSTLAQEKPSRPKIGLVLSGGGAKGFAEIGVIKVLEENGFPIDYIAGTSVGAIIGGAYSMGYRASVLDSIVRHSDWMTMMKDDVDREHYPIFVKEEDARYHLSIPISKEGIELPRGILDGQNVLKFFSDICINYEGNILFDDLPIPFRCVASDVLTGKEVVLSQGSLKKAIRASMAIPGVFTPVKWDNYMLLDGLMVNNFPVDVCRDMGADYIIGIDIQARLLKENEIKSVYSILDNVTTWMAKDTYESNVNSCDLYLRPPIDDFEAMDFNKEMVDSLIKIGEEYARSMLPRLLEVRDSLGIEPEERLFSKVPPRDNDRFFVSGIEIQGSDKISKKEVLGRLQIDPGAVTSLSHIHQGIDQIYGTGYYELVTYELIQDGYGGYILMLHVDESHTAWINVGVHYNTVNNAGLLLNSTIFGRSTFGSRLSTDVILSHRSSFSLKYNMDRGHHIGLGANVKVRDERLPLYDSYGRSNGEVDYLYTSLGLEAHSIIYDRMLIGFGAGYDWYNVTNVVSPNFSEEDILGNNYANIFAYLKYDSKNKAYFADKGWEVFGFVKTMTKDWFNGSDLLDHIIVEMNMKKYIPVTDYLTIVPAVNFRMVTWDDLPCYLMTAMGGDPSVIQMNSQLPFIGLRNMQLLSQNALIFGSDFRFKIFKDNYITGLLNIAVNSDSFTAYHQSSDFGLIVYPLVGAGVKYSYDSPIGPIELSVSGSNHSSRVDAFFSLGYRF